MNCYTDARETKYYCLNAIDPNSYFLTGMKGYLYNLNDEDHKNPFHRIDGPAIEFFNGDKEWWYHGHQISCKDNEEFLKIISMKAFL